MTTAAHRLPRPGLIGVLVRVGLGIVVLWFFGWPAVSDAPSFFDGYTQPLGSLLPLALLAYLTPDVVDELLHRRWGWRTSAVALAGLGVTIAAGAVQGDAFGPGYGTYLWAWTLVFALLLGPAFLLAAALRTPGCEMRSYAHLATVVRGGDVDAVACPGWVDRFDHVRLGGRAWSARD